MSDEERVQSLKRLRAPRLDSLQRQGVLKGIHDKARKIVTCPHCSATNGFVRKVGVLKIVHEKYNKATKKIQEEVDEFRNSFQEAIENNPDIRQHLPKAQEDLNPLKVQEILSKIPSEDCELLGLDPMSGGRPELFLWTHIPVPPACIRPSVAMTLEGGSNEDDLTIKLSEIVYTNFIIKDALEKGATVQMLMEDWDFLQLQCAMYINSELPGVPLALQSPGKPIRGLCQRLKGKMGRFRGNLSGKRVDFSARTVISPDPNLRIDQVAVPVYVAKTLTYPETVTRFNIERLRVYVVNGPDQHPGANFIQNGQGGMKRFLRFGDRKKIAKEMRIGDIVERHLIDGDVVLFNRQPSLHKLSIMAHYAVVKPWRTFRFNECACTPYNADFDGDEMNLHLPQTEEARAEAIELMGLRHNLVTPRNGNPLIAAMQDFITASYVLTQKDVFLDRSEFCQLLSGLSDAKLRFDLPPPSIVRPTALWTGKQVISALLRPMGVDDMADKFKRINLEGKTKTYSGKGLEMCHMDGWLLMREGQLLMGTLDKSSVGGDSKASIFYVLLRELGSSYTIECMTRLSKLCARYLGSRGFSIGIDDVTPGPRLRQRKEDLVAAGYTECDRNIEAFKRGELALQPGCSAEQTLESVLSGILSRIRDDCGQLCLQELSRFNAPLIMQWCGSKGSRINVSQMVACVGQQIIAGSRIPDGFQSRSLPHFPHGSKTPAAKGFVQASFYSGLSPTEFFFHAVSGREGLVDTAVKTAETGYMQRRLMKALEDLSTQYDGSVRNSTGGIVQFVYGDDGLDPALMEGDGQPLNLSRLLLSVSNSNDLTIETETDFKVAQVAEDSIPETWNGAFKKLVVDFVVKNEKVFLNAVQVVKFIGLISGKYERLRVEPGTAVGALAGQSIGEPGTQMTLKTFHFAGVASMNVTLGVPRIKEIINAAKIISTPIITAELVNKSTLPSARIVKGRVEKTLLGDVAAHIDEVVGPEGVFLRIELDLDAIQALQLTDRLTLDAIRMTLLKTSKLMKMAGSGGAQILLCPPSTLLVQLNCSQSNVTFAMQQMRRALPQVVVAGIPSVGRAVINDLGSGQGYNLLVEGYGLREVMTTEGIIGHSTTSNHISEIEQVLGIEAARSTIAHEITFTMSKHGMTIDPRHVALLADVMTYRGQVLGITRFGIAKMKDSVLMLASFEKTTDHLFDAARYAKQDDIDGVSECIIMGSPMPVGTGLFKVISKQAATLASTLIKPKELLFDRSEFHPKWVN